MRGREQGEEGGGRSHLTSGCIPFHDVQSLDVEGLADNVTLKQFLEIIILDKSKVISKATIAAAVV